jgi:hypothetical protein
VEQTIHFVADMGTEKQPLKHLLWPIYSAKAAATEIWNWSLLPLPLSAAGASELWNAIRATIPDDLSNLDQEKEAAFYEFRRMKTACFLVA